MRQPRPSLSIGFLLVRRFTLCAFANFVDVLRLAADEGDRSRPIRCAWEVLSDDMAPVRSSCGVSVSPDARLGDPKRFDYIVVVGGLIGEDIEVSPAVARFLRDAADQGLPLVGLCTGVFVLAKLGLMGGYRACVSWFHHDDFIGRFDGLEPLTDRIFVIDRDRLTCSGGQSSAHLAAELVARHVGAAEARKSLAIMIIDDAHDAEHPQPGGTEPVATDDLLVRRALMIAQVDLAAAPNAEQLARKLGVSRRTLERRFNSALGLAPAAAIRLQRLKHARSMLARSARSITDVAESTGFADPSHFSRSFRQAFGCSPEMWRTQSRQATASNWPDSQSTKA